MKPRAKKGGREGGEEREGVRMLCRADLETRGQEKLANTDSAKS